MSIRLIATLLVFFGALLAVTLLLFVTDQWLEVYQKISERGPVAKTIFFSILAVIAGFILYISWRLLTGNRHSGDTPVVESLESFEQNLDRQRQRGVATEEIDRELDSLKQSQATGDLVIHLYGQASSGKSSLIRALLPDADVIVDVIAGSTQDISRHRWQATDDLAVELVDMPGFDSTRTESMEAALRDEVIRSHLVLYLCDGDLNRTQVKELEGLTEHRKPLIVAINKADQYDAASLEKIRQHLCDELSGRACEIVCISSGGEQTYIEVDSEGNEQEKTRNREPDISALLARIMAMTGEAGDQAELVARQEQSVLIMAAGKLRDAERTYQRNATDVTVRTYSRRAMIAAMATVAPGSDIVIQTALATRFLAELGDIHDVAVRDIEIKQFIRLAGNKVRNNTAIVLALAGNAMKAFPGIGTIAGGITHAIAYGIIFEALGQAAATTMREKNELDADAAAEHLEDQLNEHIQSRAGYFAKLAIEQFKSRN